MKLSEAIRLGAMATDQGFKGYMDTPERCALAGASVAMGIVGIKGAEEGRLIINYTALRALWPELDQPSVCPYCAHESKRHKVLDSIWHLNDLHRWTRGEIADWVEVLEQRIDATHACDAVGLSVESPVAVNAR